jgi:mannose-6-phosphate isomerase-like protein (cupin superfamily)
MPPSASGSDAVKAYRASIEPLLSRLPTPEGHRWITAFTHGTLEVELYAPRGEDPQTPHERDELYVVAQGSGTLVNAGERQPFGPGDVLFAAARVPHRFEGFTGDLVVWVIFYGPEGGEGE